jgi:hypothetical protein
MEETTWGQRKVEAPFEGSQGPARAVAPYMGEWMDVSSKCFRLYVQAEQHRRYFYVAIYRLTFGICL